MRELLVWTYQAQKAHRGEGGGIGAIGHASISQTGAVLERLRLGCSVSGDGGLRLSHCPDDALTVHGHVTALEPQEARLLIRCAEMDSEPDWAPVLLPYRCVPVKGRKGQPKGIYDRHGNRVGCEVEHVGHAPDVAAAIVERARMAYRAWHSALTVLCYWLQKVGGLRRWVVTGVGAVACPWAVEARS